MSFKKRETIFFILSFIQVESSDRPEQISSYETNDIIICVFEYICFTCLLPIFHQHISFNQCKMY